MLLKMTPSSADVAQLVEQLIRNQQASGSNPLVGSIKSTNPGFRLFPETFFYFGAKTDSCGVSGLRMSGGMHSVLPF